MTVLRSILLRFETINPLLAAVIASAFLVMFISLLTSEFLNDTLNSLPNWGDVVVILLMLAFILVIPLAVIAATAMSYARAHLRLGRLVYTFLALILLFTDIYFATVVFGDRGGTACDSWQCKYDNDIPMQGVQPVWRTLSGIEGRRISMARIGLAYMDCFHYSVVTGSTVGFGDIHPTRWYTKLLTDVQILLSLGLTVLAVSRFFSSQTSPPSVSLHGSSGPKSTGK
jgi:Ion channel